MSDDRPVIRTLDDYEREYDNIIRDAMAQGWDEGYEAGKTDGVLDGMDRPTKYTNPYRD